jgi:hypothetical protein
MNEDLIIEAESLQSALIGVATGGTADNQVYKTIRKKFIDQPYLKKLLPRFVVTNGDLSQFWSYIKYAFGTYQERRDFIWGEFKPLLEYLESPTYAPSSKSIEETLNKLSSSNVHEAWNKALEKVSTDPPGAITAARTLVESVCHHILEDAQVSIPTDIDLPKLYYMCAKSLNIAPSQHTEQIFKQILGGCTSVVEGLGALRNKVGDAHGQGKNPIRPKQRHANLAVNLSGSMTTFLVETWEEKNK